MNKLRIAYPFLAITVILLFSSFLQKDQNSSFIKWSNTRLLKLSDFRIRKQNSTNNAAVSTIRISFQSILGENMMHVTSFAYFEKKSSWIDDRYIDTTTLNHEQTHFNLAEVSARKFRKQLLSTVFTAKNFDNKSHSLYSDCVKSLNTEQVKYDNATKGGDITKQRQWDEKIKNELKELEDFEKDTITIQLKL